MKKFSLIYILLTVLLLTSALVVSADEVTARHITISTADEFLQFTEDCRLDSFSQNLTVTLIADIDLTGHDFSGIPIFCGTFQGKNHTIFGVNLNFSGSYSGLFRYLTSSANVSDLQVEGTFSPMGSASYVGGIAGRNAGTIENCSVSGIVSGVDCIGGIVGLNMENGVIENCSSNGSIYGNHFVGGIAGNNSGIVKNCSNASAVNTVLQQNHVDLSEITMDALTGTESVATVTDIGGIAGISSGFISGCKNSGDVGYPRIGYNIGGIAGSQTGYIVDCINTGSVSGRKEIGGIVGQLEPVLAITYAADTLQILQGQLNQLSILTDTAAAHVESTVSGVSNQLVLMRGRIKSALDALEALKPGEDTPSLEDFSHVVQTLQDTASAIDGSLQTIYTYLKNGEDTLSHDMDDIANAVSNMEQTLNQASDHLGGAVSDHSDADTENDLTAKVARCQNSGAITADRNGGGIAGAIAFESDLDPEADIDIFGQMSLNFTGSYRAVITDCVNDASVSVKKQHAGGIVGYAALGLVRSCFNTAQITCPSADYVGGIAGKCDGIIRNCSVKSVISAETFAGGIAGQGKTVADCLVLCQVSASEKLGAILGYAEDMTSVSNNRYLLLGSDSGAIDSISYDSAAQSVCVDDFLKIPDLPEFFKNYTVSFVFPDEHVEKISLNTGKTLSAEQIPQLPLLDGCKGSWIGLDSISCFDTVITASYETKLQILQSQEVRQNGLPILLAEGSFLPDYRLEITLIQENLPENTSEGWSITNSGIQTLRYLPQENTKNLCVMVKTEDGNWVQVPHTVNGSYFVFDIDAQTTTFCVVSVQNTPLWLYGVAGAAILCAMGVISAILIKRKKTKKSEKAESEA